VADDLSGQQSVVDAFLAASRSGDLDALLALLDPDVLLHADPAAVRMGSPREVHGAAAVAAVLSGRALAARPALVDGLVGVTWAPVNGTGSSGTSPRSAKRLSASTWWPTPTASTSSIS